MKRKSKTERRLRIAEREYYVETYEIYCGIRRIASIRYEEEHQDHLLTGNNELRIIYFRPGQKVVEARVFQDNEPGLKGTGSFLKRWESNFPEGKERRRIRRILSKDARNLLDEAIYLEREACYS